MSAQQNLKQFDEIYYKTYNDVLKYVICHIANINDVNDIMQDIYMELYKILARKDIGDLFLTSFVIGIAKNKIKKHYNYFYRIRTISLFSKNTQDFEIIDNIDADIDIEKIVIANNLYDDAWQYIKTKKDVVSKIFYLYYVSDLTIKDIATELNLTESCVKNHLYRTLIELQEKFRKDGI